MSCRVEGAKWCATRQTQRRRHAARLKLWGREGRGKKDPASNREVTAVLTLMSRRAAAKRALIECACLRRIDGLAVGEEAGWVLNRAAPATSGRQRNIRLTPTWGGQGGG